jgi:hypothetical protein
LDYYTVLGVSPKASVEEIERAYRTLARQVHPDRNTGDAERAEARMKQLNQIRETLTDPLLRVAYDDQLRREQGPLRSEPPRPQPAEAPASSRSQRPPRYEPHPHVVPFLRTEAERAAARPYRPQWGPVLAMVVVLALAVTAMALLWPRPEPVVQRPIAVAAAPPPPKPQIRPAVTIVRGDTAATRRAIRRTAKVVPLGFTFDEVVAKFGPPDRVESHPAPGDVTLIYGEVRLELREGKVVGGAP